jgi:hypothetical protein
MLDSIDMQQYYELLGPGGYLKSRHVYQLAGRTDWGRAVHSPTRLQWEISVPEGSAPGGEIKALRDSPILVGPEGLLVQIFVFTAWGGRHFAEFRNVEVKLKMGVNSRSKSASKYDLSRHATLARSATLRVLKQGWALTRAEHPAKPRAASFKRPNPQ